MGRKSGCRRRLILFGHVEVETSLRARQEYGVERTVRAPWKSGARAGLQSGPGLAGVEALHLDGVTSYRL